jgi:hypothetical protein
MDSSFKYNIYGTKAFGSDNECETTFGTSGAISAPSSTDHPIDKQRQTLVECLEKTRFQMAVTTSAQWAAVNAKRSNVPDILKLSATDLSPFGTSHLIARVAVNLNGQEGDNYDTFLFVAHKEGPAIVIDAYWAFHTIWVH